MATASEPVTLTQPLPAASSANPAASPADTPAVTLAASATERADRIVTAANDLLGDAGLEGLTIRAVLLRTGLARRAFYERFAGKDDLVLAVFGRSLDYAAMHFAQQIRDEADPLERIRTIVVGIVMGPLTLPEGREDGDGDGIDRRSAALSREHLRLAEARPRELEAALRPLLDLITAQVAEGMRAGQVRRADPALLAMLVYNLVATTTHTELLNYEGPVSRARRAELADAIWDFCRRAISAAA